MYSTKRIKGILYQGLYPWNSSTELAVQKKDKNTVIVSFLNDMKRITVNKLFVGVFLAAVAEVFFFHNYRKRGMSLYLVFFLPC